MWSVAPLSKQCPWVALFITACFVPCSESVIQQVWKGPENLQF